MESDAFICVRETTGDKSQVVIVDVSNPTQPLRFPISADKAIMNPTQPILALKAQQQLQIFNIRERKRLVAHEMPEAIDFWKWISSDELALVTAQSVYHWSTSSGKAPVRVFPRHASLASTQIINYRASEDGKWLCLVGIAQREGRIAGSMQLYSIERKVSQPIEGHACAFATFPVGDRKAQVFAFASRTAAASKLYIIEVGKQGDGPGYERKAADIYFPVEAADDFPVAMQVSEKYSVLYMITKFGYIHVFDLGTGTTIYMNRISAETIFVTAPQSSTGGLVGVNRRGQVLSVTMDENNVIPYIVNQLKNIDVAVGLATRAGLPGAEKLFDSQFQQHFAQGNYKAAAAVAADSPGGILRSASTIQKFSQAQAFQGQPSPLFQYFGVLLERGKLNQLESRELGRVLVQQQRKDLLEKWMNEQKLTCSEELGDLVRTVDPNLALKVYFVADCKAKVVDMFAVSGQFDKIVAYAQKVNYSPDWSVQLQRVLATSPQQAVGFANMLLQAQPPMVNVEVIVDLFMQRNMVPETTSILLDALKGNKPEEGPLQTRLLEINLMAAPQVADYILGNSMFSHYDQAHIAVLCEKAGLYQRALEHYTDFGDMKRVIVSSPAGSINPEFMVGYFANMSVEESLETLKELMRVNRANVQIVVQVGVKYWEQLTAQAIMEIFETFEAYDGSFYFLGQIIPFSEEPEVHYKYIEAAARIGQWKEVERICRESNHYDPERTRDFLKSINLQDMLPLIIVCDRFGFVDDLTKYLYKKNLQKYIEVYVTKINPINTPAVVGALLDCECSEDYVLSLAMNVRNQCPVNELVDEVEKRNRLKLILPWLEARVQEGNQEPALHNAIAKIFVDMNQDPESFLKQNQFYDSRVVGKYCEHRDPHLAFVAYERGQCDDELLEVTNKNGLFKSQARYLVRRQDGELWAKALDPENEYRRSIIDQVVQTALPESTSPDEVSATVQAFMTAKLPNELIELLEKIVLESTQFQENRNLQNLLILTAVKADQGRVMDYVNRLEHYDGPDIASIAVGSGLFEEAFTVFKKFGHNVEAVDVLLTHLDAFERAFEFADRVDEPAVYSKLGNCQLEKRMIKEAVDSFLKSSDASSHVQVIALANQEEAFDDLVRYLQMCRKEIKESRVESELVYAFARVGMLADLEEFISGPNVASIQEVGDRCYNEKLYEAAKLCYENISNYARLATTLVRLEQYQAAVDAARKANSTRSWKEVNKACVDAAQFRLAQVAGLYIVVHGDELDELIQHYLVRGHFEEVIALLEAGLGLERAHVGMFTELAILYSKFKPEKLQDHLNLFHSRLNIPKVLRVVEQNRQWSELTFLYIHYDEYDNAALTMMQHVTVAWQHMLFKDVIVKVANLDYAYRAIRFYIDFHPGLLSELLNTLTARVDATRVVKVLKDANEVPLAKNWLQSVQEGNVKAVNEALNELLVNEEDHENLRISVDAFDNFDQIELAQRIEKHEVLEFRRISAYLYKKNGRWSQSLELSKRDALYKDAMQTAADSGDQDLVESLMRFFVDQEEKECFSACLYTCYDLVRPDVAMELAWRHSILDNVMPFMINSFRELHNRVGDMEAHAKKKEEEEAAAKEAATAVGMAPASMVDPSTGVVYQTEAPPQSYYPPPGSVMPGTYAAPMSMVPNYGGPAQHFSPNTGF